jgi:hypothetical protein
MVTWPDAVFTKVLRDGAHFRRCSSGEGWRSWIPFRTLAGVAAPLLADRAGYRLSSGVFQHWVEICECERYHSEYVITAL